MPPTIVQDYQQQLIQTILDLSKMQNWWTSPLNLGGGPGPEGGSGIPIGDFFGQLIQSKVAFDTTEAAILEIPASGTSLVTNLDRIRYRLGTLEASGIGGSGIVLQHNDAFVDSGVVILNFEGSGVEDVASDGPGKVTVTISGTPSHTLGSATHTDVVISAVQDEDLLEYDSGSGDWVNIAGAKFAGSGHLHDDRYYLESEVDALLHSPVTVVDTASINLELTGQALSGYVVGMFSGSGTPEGNVVAPIGSRFYRDDGGPASAAYIKDTGTDDTGWWPLGATGVFNVKSYGATGDGTTDDTVAIQAAFDAADTGFGGWKPVYFPSGQYRYTDALNQPLSNFHIFGDGSLPGTQGGTELRYAGNPALDFWTIGSDGNDASNFTFRNLRILPHASITPTAGYALRIINPTNSSHVDRILASGGIDGAISVDNATGGGGGNPGPNFFRLSNFFAIGGINPVRIKGGRQIMMIDHGGIDLDATSLQGMLCEGGEGQGFALTISTVKVEGDTDVPGFKVTSIAPVTFIGCTRLNLDLNGTAAGFQYTNPSQENCQVTLIGCTVLGTEPAFDAPGLGASVPGNALFGRFIPYYFSASNLGMIGPFDGAGDAYTIHKDVKIEWTDDAGDSGVRDVNLYRSAADVLKTDDSLDVGGAITGNSYFDLQEIAEPGNPATNVYRIYPESDAELYGKNDAGVEVLLSLDEINELSDVSVGGATQGELLTYDGAIWVPSGVSGASPTDHGTLTGLSDDDHLQYALLAGRAGGQTLVGGTGAGDNLQLTSNDVVSLNPGGTYVDIGLPFTNNKSLRFWQGDNGTASGIVHMRADFDNFYITNAGGAVVIEQAVDASRALALQEPNSPFARATFWYDGVSAGGTGLWLSGTSGADNINLSLPRPVGSGFVYVRDVGGTVVHSFGSDGSVVLNEDGSNSDFRVESDTIQNALFVQGSDGFVGIGTGFPQSLIHASGVVTINDYTDMQEISAPGTPASNFFRIYPKTDGDLYGKNDAGTELLLSLNNLGELENVDLTGEAANEFLAFDGANWIPSGVAPGGVSDHGALTGLGDDDHSQYALLAGRAGGQTLLGGISGSDKLILSTVNLSEVVVNEAGQDVDFRIESKTNTSAFHFVASGGLVGLGNNDPNQRFHIDGIAGAGKDRGMEMSGKRPFIFIDHTDTVGFAGGLAFMQSGITEMEFFYDTNADTLLFWDTAGAGSVFDVGRTGQFVTRPQAGTDTIFNEDGADANFRIEGDTATVLFEIDAGLDSVFMGTTVRGAIAEFRPTLVVFNPGGDPDQDFRIETNSVINAFVVNAGSNEVRLGTAANGEGALAHFGTTIIFNEGSADIDFRVESNNDFAMFFLNAGTDRIGLRTNAPDATLDIRSPSAVANPLRLHRDTNTETAGLLFEYAFDNSSNVEVVYADVNPIIATNTAGSETGQIVWRTRVGGTLASRMILQSGLQIGTPTGGDKGVGTINVDTDIYKDDTAYTNPDWVLEEWADGKMPPSLSEVEEYARREHQLMDIDREPMGLFERGDVALLWIERLTIYIFEQERRLKALESKIHSYKGK